jgi:choline dehydrogenase
VHVDRAEAGLGGRALKYPRGRVLGGCSSINGMIYMRGQAADYDGWRQAGNPGWGWDDVLPCFKQRRGPLRGPRRISRQRRRNPYREAAAALGHPRGLPRAACAEYGVAPVDDFNTRRQ